MAVKFKSKNKQGGEKEKKKGEVRRTPWNE